jgi:hypothetical protein
VGATGKRESLVGSFARDTMIVTTYLACVSVVLTLGITESELPSVGDKVLFVITITKSALEETTAVQSAVT